jgi:hypothetical protein
MATTSFTTKNPKVDPNKNLMKVPPMAKGGDVTKAPQVGTTTKPVVKNPVVGTTPKTTGTPSIGATTTSKYTFTPPKNYETGYVNYKALAGKKDDYSLRQRRDLATWLSKNKPTVGAGTPPINAGTGVGTPPPTETGREAETFNPLDYIDQLDTGEADTGTGLIDPTMWEEVLKGLSQQGQWNSNIRMPTQQELAELYAKNYEQQLADLSYGVEGKQQQMQKAREQQLADRGISFDSQAYRNEQANLAEQRASEDALLRTQARGFAQEQANAEFDRALKGSQMEMDKARLEQDLKYRGVEALSPLAMSEAQLKNNRWLAQFDAKTQGAFLKANLDQQDSQFIKGLNQDQQQWLGNIAQQEMDRAQNDKQFQANMKQIVNEFKFTKDQRKKEFYEEVRNNKELSQLDKEKLVELVRNNKETLALQWFAARKAGSGGKETEDLDALTTKIVAIGDATIEVERRRKEAGLDPLPPGGISYGVGG